MKHGVTLVCLCAAVVLVSAHPLDSNIQRVARQSDDGTTSTNLLSREKRTIGILRDLFPNFSRIIDNKIQQLTRIIFRIVGRLVLNGGGGGGGGGGGNSSDDERRISITLPTYPPEELEDDEDENSTDSASEGTSDDAATATTTTPSPNGEEISDGESNDNEVRIKREAPNQVAPEEEANAANAAEEADTAEEEDLDSEATGDNEVAGDGDEESSEAEEEEVPEGDDRNKRFLNFNAAATAESSNGGGGSAGGSGNFLFDIIRLVAGSGSGSSGSGDSGSSGNGEGKHNDDGVGVPGPLTRLFVVANRGVASLIQDLILRLAQTSERIVNFKARLITSLI